MRIPLKSILAAVLIAVLAAVQGCGLKPGRGIPSGTTPEEIVAAVERQTVPIETFSGTASVKVSSNGGSETATVLVRYINPGLFRVYLKGFAGIDMGRISALADSLTVYIPPENMFLKAGRDEAILEKLFPELDLDVETLELLFNSTYPLSTGSTGSRTTVNRIDDAFELSVTRGDELYRYRVAGSGLRLIREEYLVDDTLVWRKTLSDYASHEGVDFPEEITVERGKDSFTIHFSECEINTGLTERDLTFTVPASAERVYIENSR